jgi:hypothetical protein
METLTTPAQEFTGIADIRAHLPTGAVLLPFPIGGKNPGIRDWSRITREQTADPGFKVCLYGREHSYAKLLRGAEYHRGNVGVVLGEASENLCTVDADSDDALAAFRHVNPGLNRSLITKRKRGGQLWLQLDEPCPRLTPIKRDTGEPWGEWRGSGGMSVLFGEARDRRKGETEATRYACLNRAKVVRAKLDEIVWPPGVVPPDWSGELKNQLTSLRLGPCVSGYLGICVPGSLGHKALTSVAENLSLQASAESFLEDKANMGIRRLYDRLIGPKFSGMAGSRNGFIMEAMPFLYRVVSPEIALKLALVYFLSNKAKFNASADEHLRSAESHLGATARVYPGELSDDELAAYAALDDRAQLVFRVCRDLALYDAPDKPKDPMTFFASFAGLSERTGLQREQLSRIVGKFIGAGVMALVEKGTSFSALTQTGPRKASVYQWRLPVPMDEVKQMAGEEQALAE